MKEMRKFLVYALVGALVCLTYISATELVKRLKWAVATFLRTR